MDEVTIVYRLSSIVEQKWRYRGRRVLDIFLQPAALARDKLDRRVIGRVEPSGLVGIGKQRGPADNAQAEPNQKRESANNITHCINSSMQLTPCGLET